MPVNFDELADETFGQAKEAAPVAPPNKYDALADELFNDQRTEVAHALYVADKQEPDRKAQVLKLAAELKLPADLVDRNFDDLNKQKTQRTASVDDIISKTPGLSRFLQDPDNATLAKDDLHNLSKIEDGVNKLAPQSEGFFSDVARAGKTGYNQLSKSTYALAAAYGKVDIQTAAEAMAEHYKKSEELRSKMPDYSVQFKKDMSEGGEKLTRGVNAFVKSYGEMRQGHIRQALIDFASAENRSVGETLGLIYSAGKNPKGLGYATVENLANSFPGLVAGGAAGLAGAAVAGPVGGAAGYLGGAFVGEYLTEVGSWVDQEMSKRGVDMTNPDAIAGAFRDPKLMSAIRTEAERKGIGTAGVGLLFNALPVLGFGFSKAATGVIGKVARKAGDVGVQMIGESAGEAAGQLAVAKGDITKVDWGEVAQEGIITVGHSFGEASLGKAFSLAKEGAAVSRRALLSADPIEAASEVAENIKSANQSINNAKVLGELGDIVKESKLAGRMPEKIKELIGKIDFMGEPQAVYFQTDDFDSYWNKKGLSPAKAAEQILGDGGKAYQEAKEMGQPLKVSLGDFVEKVAPSEEDYNGLLAHARMAPDAMSLTEAREEIKSTPATMQDLAREAKAQSDTQGIAPNETAKAQKESIVNQMKGMGYSAYEASRVGALHESVMQTFGEGATAKANALLARYGIQITSPTEVVQLEAGQSVLNQSGKQPVLTQQNELGFYSKLEQTIAQKMGNSQDTTSLKAMLKDIKPEEMKWSGLDELLKSKEKVSKQEVLDYLRANQLEVKEVTKGNVGQAVEVGATVYGVFNEDGEWAGSFLHEANAANEARKLTKEDDQEYTVQSAKWDGETTLEDVEASTPDGLTKFSQYTLPGGENYREVLFTLPEKPFAPVSFDDKYRDINNWEKSERFSNKTIKKSLVEENTEFISKKKETIKFIKKHVGDMTPKAIGELLDKIIATTYKPLTLEDLSTDNQAVVDKVNELTALHRKLRYPSPAETMYKIRAPDDSKNLVIYNDNRPDGGFYTGDQIGKNKFFKTFDEAVSYLENDINERAQIARPDIFLSSHYDESNILAHTRLNDRVDADGKKVLFVEEIQSDWHQAGRKKGYQGEGTQLTELPPGYSVTEYKGAFNVMSPDNEVMTSGAPTKDGAVELALAKINSNASAVPDAPFKKTWHEFVFKRILRMAAEQGYDRVAWTTGEQQAERYDLSKQVGHIDYKDNGDGTYKIGVARKDGYGSVYKSDSDTIDKIEETLGKDIAEKIKNGEGKSGGGRKTLEGLDLKVGGEGMKGFYDKMLVDYANKLGKKFGAKVGETTLAKDEDGGEGYFSDGFNSKESAQRHIGQIRIGQVDGARSEGVSYHITKSENTGLYHVSETTSTAKVHSLDITPQLKEAAINEGFALFQDTRGRIIFGSDRKFNIELFKGRDPSTLLHELGHFYLEVFGDLAQTEGATKRITDDYAKLLNWFGVADRSQIKVEHHEQFARGFEKYLMEGKAPTLELRKLFATFKAWLVSVYRKASNLNVEMSDEIRGVFDRMIATEAEINKAEKAAGISEPLFLDPKSVGMSDAEAARYIEMIEEARLASEDKVRAELMAIAQKEQDQFHRQKKKEFISQSTEQVSAMPVYKAIDHLRGAVPEGSIPIKIDKQYLVDQYDKSVRDKLPTGITSTTDGVHPDMVAQMYGFESGDDLITAMANMPTKKAMIDQIVSQKMAELTQDPIYTGTVSESAVQAVHNDKLEALKRFELEFMMKYDKKGFKDATKRLIKRLPLSKESRETARRILGDVNVGDIKPHQYMLAERRYAGLAAKAWAAGDVDLAFEHKKKELLNFYMYQESVDAKETIDKTLKQFKKISKSDEDVSKTRDVDMVNAARALLAKFGLDRMDKTPEQYLEQMKQYDPMAYDTMLAIVESVSEGAAPYKRVSYQTFQDLKESVFSIWDLAKTSREIEINGKRVSRDEAIANLSARVDELAPNAEKPGYKKALGKWDKTKMKLLQFRAAMTRVEHWISATDKDFSGPFRTYVFNPIMDGVIKYRSEKKKLIEQYKAHVETHKNLFTTKAIKADGLGFEFKDMAHLLGAILHSGNTSNLSKLLRGYGWGDINEDGSLNRSRWDAQIRKFYQDGTLTKAHMDFIQGVWDMFEQIKPDLQRSHKQMLGFYFAEVTANEVETPWGTYRGGYAPAKADQLIVEDAKIRAEIESFENMNPSFNFPTSGKGSTMKRVESYAAPLQLDLNLVGSHLDWAMRFAHIEPRVKEVNRIMLNKAFREQLSKLDPNAASDMFIPWLQRVAQQTAVKTSQDSTGKVLDAFSKLVRRNVAMQVMTLNVTNTLQQYTGMVVAMTKVKPRFIRNGLVDYIKDIKGTTKFISESSKWMNQNMTNNVYEAQQAIEQIMLNPSTFDKAKDFATRHQYFLQTAAQNHVNTVVWMGAYNQAIESGETHDQSVKMADSAVRLTQGSAAVEDISEFETGTATARLFKQFVMYFNMLANLNASEVVKISREIGIKKGAGKMLYVYMMGVAIPAALSEVIVKAMAGKFDEDDDDEYLDDALSIFFGSQARTLTAMTPYVGTYVQTSMNQFNNQRWDDRISLSPAISAIEATTSAPKSVYDAIQGKTNAEKKALRDVLLLIGVASGLPLAPLSKPLGYGLDVKSGKAQPSGPFDFTRGLITGKPGAK